jgi:hypothetical protein
MSKAARVRQQTARAKIAAQQQAARRAETRRRMLIVGGSVVAVIAIVVALVVVKALGHKIPLPPGAGRSNVSAAAALGNVPASTLD